MKKIGNKFILTVILVILFIVCFQVFIAYSNNNNDTNSYLTLVKWNGTLNEIRLSPEREYVLSAGDKIRVIWDSSLAVIQWWDGSLTRLGGNTKISIQQNEISRDYTNINISFDLIAGKTWSNVVSFIGNDSSFTQTFDGIEAWVRGTVFDVNLEEEFIHVTDHQIELKDISGNSFMVSEWKTLSLNDFSLLDISEFISSLEDSTWRELNKQFDNEYLEILKSNLSQSFNTKLSFLFVLDFISPKYRILHELNTAENYESIEVLLEKVTDSKKQNVYKAVLSKYQDINFVGAWDYEAYKQKLFYKKALITLSDNNSDTERLLQSSAYDLEDIITSKGLNGLSETISLLGENKDIVKNIDMSFLSGGLEYIPEDLIVEFKNNFEDLSDILNFDMNAIKDIDSNSLWDLLDSTDDVIGDFLDKNVWGLLQDIAK
jgi:hypothetical protein